jgi:chromosome partitioning protein
MKILTIANRKGGAGKSTCAAHIAIEAVKSGIKTILIDLDPQKTLEAWWSKRDNDEPYMAEVSAIDLEEKLGFARNKGMELCIIDTPGDASSISIKGIEVADLVLIPSKATVPDLTAIGRTINMVRKLEKPYMFLLTQIVTQTRSAVQAISVLSEFGPVAPYFLANRIAYSNAMGSGSSAASEDKVAASELKEIWAYIKQRLFNEPASSKKKII